MASEVRGINCVKRDLVLFGGGFLIISNTLHIYYNESRYCGIDFASTFFKASIVTQRRRRTGKCNNVIYRVGFYGRPDYPERPPNSNASLYEFALYAVLRKGRLTTGRRAIYQKVHFTLKTAVIYLAGLPRKIIKAELSDGPALFSLLDSRQISKDDLRDAVLEHLTMLRSMIRSTADELNIHIITLTITFPTYLYGDNRWVEAYVGYLIERLWVI